MKNKKLLIYRLFGLLLVFSLLSANLATAQSKKIVGKGNDYLVKKAQFHKIDPSLEVPTTGNFVKKNVVSPNAKATVLYETFSAGSLPAGWQNTDNYGDGVTWSFNNPSGMAPDGGSFDGSFASIDSDDLGYYTVDADLITPVINCSSMTMVLLEFDSFFNYYTGDLASTVSVSTDGAAWTEIASYTSDHYSPGLTQAYDISSVAAGQATVYVKWNYQAYYSWYWAIDNVKVYEPSLYDFTLTIPNNASVKVGQSYQYAFTLKNTGINSDDYSINFTSGDQRFTYVVLDSDGSTEITDAVTVASGDSKTFYFQVTVNAYANDGITDARDVTVQSVNSSNLNVTATITTTSVSSILGEGFEGGTTPSGWLNIDSDGDDWFWQSHSPGPHGGSYSFASASYDYNNQVPLTPDNWLITPQINISGSGCKLSFWVAAQDADYPADYYGVAISTGSTNLSDFTQVYGETLSSDVWKEIVIDLSAYSGKQIYIAFRHYQSVDNFIMKIDDVNVSAPDVPGNMIYDYSFAFMASTTEIDQNNKTIDVTVPFGVSVDTLTAVFATTALDAVVKVGSTLQVSGETKNDFTNPVTYKVATAAGVTRNYIVSVTKEEPVAEFNLVGSVSSSFRNDTAFYVVPANADLTGQVVEFTMADPSYKLMDGTAELVSGTSEVNVTAPLTLTAVAGEFEKNYVVIATKEAALNAFGFIGYTDEEEVYHAFPTIQLATIDYVAATVDVVVPYGTPLTALRAVFNTQSYVTAVAFGETTLINGTTDADYSEAGNLTLTLADPTKAPEVYTLTVTHDDGSSANEILSVTGIKDLAGSLSWDTYGRIITGEIMYDSSMVINPVFSISPLATIEGDTTAYDFTEGPVKYTVISENGIEAVWTLILTEKAPSTAAEMVSFDFDGNYFGWIEDTVVYNYADAAIDLTAIVPSITTSFGASVIFGAVSPTVTASNDTADFTTQPLLYTVQAQDGKTKQNYAVYVTPEEYDAPVVSLTPGSFGNVDGEADVKIVDASSVFGLDYALVNKDFMDEFLAKGGEIKDYSEDGNYATYSFDGGSLDSLFKASTYGLKTGIFYAIAQDAFGNLSDWSADSIVITIDTMEVSTIAEINNPFVIYKYTGEAIVTYTQTYRNQKFIQDETGGIVIDDKATTVYLKNRAIEGDAITGFVGKFVNYYNTLEFQPSDTLIEVVSQNNVVEPVELTLDEFNADLFEYQNMLVKVNFVKFADADNSNYFTGGVKYGISSVANGQGGTFRTSFYSADYIGDIIPEGTYSVVGIKNVYTNESCLTARNWSDMTQNAGYAFAIDPTEWNFQMVGVNATSNEFTLSNVAVEPYTVKRIWIEGAPQFTVDQITDVTVQPFGTYTFVVDFVAEAYTSYSATLNLELANGDMKQVALKASVITAPVVAYPYSTDLNTESAIEGWTVDNMSDGVGFQWGEGLGTTNSFYRVGYNNPLNPDHDEVLLISPAINMSSAVAPVLKWDNTMINALLGYADCGVYVSVDEKQNWDRVADVATANRVITSLSVDLAAYVGYSKVYIGFYIYEPETGAGSPVTWWDIDNIEVKESPTTPIFAISTEAIDLGAVDGSASSDLTISNIGVSYYTLNSVTLKAGSAVAFTLTNAPVAAVDVYTEEVNVTVNFDGTLGESNGVVLVDYTDPRTGNHVVEVPVGAIGVGCGAAIAAVVGTNVAPYAPSWFEYTPADDALVTISACGDVADTDVKVYAGCDGTLVGANDDNGNCTSNKNSSEVTWAVRGGVTYKIKWLATWDASGFEWTLESSELPTGPELVSAVAKAVSAESAKVVLTFNEMYQIDPQTKAGKAIVSGINSNFSDQKRSEDEFELLPSSIATKDFTPDGDPEVEPNNGPVSVGGDDTYQVIELGTEDAMNKITGFFGAANDPWDWFQVDLTESAYIHATCEIAAGDIYLWVVNGDLSGTRLAVTSASIGEINTELYEAGTYYIIVQPLVAADDPGIGYNLKAWGTQPPTFTIYRDNYKIAGPTPMAFNYTDESIGLNTEYCYTVTQEMYDGTESGMSNAKCVTAKLTTGIICELAAPVVIGMNQSPSTPYWFKYTATETTGVKISSNIEENGDPSEDWNDTWLFIYANCGDATALYEVDDVVNGQVRTSEVEFVAAAGETYLIQWRRWAPEGEVNAYDGQPFFFTFETAPVQPGEYVENAIPVTLPLVDFAGTSEGYNHNYDNVCGDEFFTQGNDIVYSFEVPYGGTITGSITGEWVGIHVFKGKVGSETAVAFEGGETGGSFSNKAVGPGTYYILVSTQKPTIFTDFIIDLEFAPYAQQSVTFNVDMSVQEALGNFNPATDEVDVVGTFNRWEHTANMTAGANGIYSYTLPDQYYVGEQIRYKYRINGDWAKAELSDSTDVYRTWTVKNGTNSSDDIYDKQELPKFEVTFRVIMSQQVSKNVFNTTTGNVKLDLSGETIKFDMKDVDGDMTYEYTAKNVDYGPVSFKFIMDGVDETVTDSRAAEITNDTTITVWYNNEKLSDVPEFSSDLISIYPNPSNGKFTLNLGQNATSEMNVEVLNVQGQVVNVVDMNSAAQDVDMSTYAKGVYYLRISNGENVNIQKLVIQ